VNFLYYTLVRFGIMAVVFCACVWFGTGLILGGLFAVIIGFAVSYLAFPRLHAAAGRDFARLWHRIVPRRRRRTAAEADAEVEDSYVDERLRREGREV
jgi:short subunit fatty acids transporter